MRKILSIVLASAMVLSLAACGKTDNKKPTGTVAPSNQEHTALAPTGESNTPDENNKTDEELQIMYETMIRDGSLFEGLENKSFQMSFDITHENGSAYISYNIETVGNDHRFKLYARADEDTMTFDLASRDGEVYAFSDLGGEEGDSAWYKLVPGEDDNKDDVEALFATTNDSVEVPNFSASDDIDSIRFVESFEDNGKVYDIIEIVEKSLKETADYFYDDQDNFDSDPWFDENWEDELTDNTDDETEWGDDLNQIEEDPEEIDSDEEIGEVDYDGETEAITDDGELEFEYHTFYFTVDRKAKTVTSITYDEEMSESSTARFEILFYDCDTIDIPNDVTFEDASYEEIASMYMYSIFGLPAFMMAE